jgi:hypothetical protein
MGNKKTRREAGQLLKQYGLPKLFAHKKYPSTSQARFIRDILTLKHGDLVYDQCTEMNHRVIGFLEDHEPWEGPCRGYRPTSIIYHLVYEGNLLGTSAFEVDPPKKDALTLNPFDHPEIVERLIQEERITHSESFNGFMELMQEKQLPFADAHCGNFMELKR